jgi:hypothetical protein
MIPTNALPTRNYSYQRPTSGPTNAFLTPCQRLPTACLPTPHTPRGVGNRLARGSEHRTSRPLLALAALALRSHKVLIP